MIYLKDTCVFINRFNSLGIIQLLQNYKNSTNSFGVTDIVINELNPGRAVEAADAEKSKSMLGVVNLLEKSRDLVKYDVETEEKYQKNFQKIRKQFYGHLNDLNFVKKALAKKEITNESFKNRTYKFKDYGECSCIAVAMLEPEEVSIVSDDKGRVFLKPNINLFDKYKESHGIKVLEYEEWLSECELNDYSTSKSS
ncbi:hypothetical protein [Alkalihalobacillus pseudalcaliphilus]|uniref:hypothetical protein n=1 Tax=Alkalihalobacillus pseudalcaliphilus TaxID=79884 RepID=UPI00064E1026|nr:hypothetical protein [Alkalihalobacillus pseudalcaliphilus]KMK77961.1 hypothetical protein AB990_00420 [Alkalihalobacillus pseudalcaliphilus]